MERERERDLYRYIHIISRCVRPRRPLPVVLAAPVYDII